MGRSIRVGIVSFLVTFVVMVLVTSSGSGTLATTSLTHPSARWGPNMVYDSKDGYVLLFGGSDARSDTWAFSTGVWTQLSISPAPGPRAHAGFAYDTADGYAVLFGGQYKGILYGDTWTYSGGVWTNITLTAGKGPSGRTAPGMTYDSADGYVLLFGGMNSAGKTPGDTWEFSHGQWKNVTGTTGATPLARFAEGLVYDATDGYTLMYGGWGVQKGIKNKALNDSWEFLGGVWKQLHPLTNPGLRWFVGMTFDSRDGYILQFGGINDSGVKSNWNTPPYTWTYHAGTWTNVTNLSDAPGHRFAEGLVDDPAAGNVLMFGGLNSTAVVAHSLSDTWTFSSTVWKNITKTA
jgi:hypothetical protein